jgi:hypothetical protein
LYLLQWFKSEVTTNSYKDVALWEKGLSEAFEILKTVNLLWCFYLPMQFCLLQNQLNKVVAKF